MDLDSLLAALQLGETQDWEFKSAKGGFPGSFWETYSAMSNTEGGTIVLGVAERNGEAIPDGLNPASLAKYQKALWDGANNRVKVSRCILSTSDVKVAEVGSSRLLVVHVPRADRTARPVHLGHDPLTSTFRRAHEGDYRCTESEVRRMLADADPVSADSKILDGFSLADIDLPSLAQYRQRLRSAKGEHPWLSLDDRAFLEMLGCWRRDRNGKEDGLTLAGLLMFGKDHSIRDPDAAPAYFVDYRERLDPSTRYNDRLCPDGTWEANLFQFYQRALPKLSSGLPTPFMLEGLERRDVTPAHEALREAFVNALIHADYRAEGGIVIERFPDRFQIENPGILLVSLEQYHRGGTSECRNKSLQTMFHLIGGGDHAGSGVARIKEGWASRHWRNPSLELTMRPDRFRLALPMVSLIPQDTLVGLRALYGSDLDGLAAEELQAIATASIEGRVTNARLQELIGSHPVDITRMLLGLCQRGLLLSDNKRRWTSYRLNVGSPSLFPDIAKTIDESTDSTQSAQDSTHSAQNSTHGAADSLQSNGAASGTMSKEVLLALAAPIAANKRTDSEIVREVILKLCGMRPFSADDLAGLLNRNAQGLRERYLGPLVDSGLLRLRFPTSPNHPDQAYTAQPRHSEDR